MLFDLGFVKKFMRYDDVGLVMSWDEMPLAPSMATTPTRIGNVEQQLVGNPL
jgi:hypothetical protein